MTQQYWYCAECFSQNRANANRCYRCQLPRAQAAEAPGNGPAYRAAGTGPTDGTVLTPGVDEEHRRAARAVMDATLPAERIPLRATKLRAGRLCSAWSNRGSTT
jgi:hypothetical protein